MRSFQFSRLILGMDFLERGWGVDRARRLFFLHVTMILVLSNVKESSPMGRYAGVELGHMTTGRGRGSSHPYPPRPQFPAQVSVH